MAAETSALAAGFDHRDRCESPDLAEFSDGSPTLARAGGPAIATIDEGVPAPVLTIAVPHRLA